MRGGRAGAAAEPQDVIEAWLVTANLTTAYRNAWLEDKVHSMLSVGKAQLGRSAGGLLCCFPVEFRRVILCVNPAPGGG